MVSILAFFPKMKVKGILSQPFTIQNGLRQGEPLPTTLFNLALECAARKITVKTDDR
jgi:hypothetical protein